MPDLNIPFVSIITPCRNEIDYIQDFIESMFSQDYPHEKFELIIADGESNDGTYEKLLQLQKNYSQLIVIKNLKKTTPIALNLAIRKSKGTIIVRTDCHSQYPANYVSELVKNLIELKADNVGVPWITTPKQINPKTIAISKALSSQIAVGSSLFRTTMPLHPIQTDTVPYGCFHRELFDRIGFFSELLTRNQDDEFNSRILKNGGKIFLLPGPPITYYSRLELKKLYKMFFQYGLFKPLSNLICGRLSSLRQLAPIGFQLTFFVILFSIFNGILPFFIMPLYLFAYVITILLFGIFSLERKSKISDSLVQLLYFEFATIIIHQSYGFGYFLGLFRLITKFRNKIDLAISR